MFRLITQNPMDEFRRFGEIFNDDFMYQGFKMDVQKTDDGYLVSADLPGFTKDEIKMSYEKNILTIEAIKETIEETVEYLHKERTYTHLKRTLHLPDVEASKIKAKLEHGVLNITLPKTKTAQEILISIEE